MPVEVLHCAGPVSKAASSLWPPAGGLKSIQLKLPVAPPPASNLPLYQVPATKPNPGAGPLLHSPNGIAQLVCAGATVATAAAATVCGPTPTIDVSDIGNPARVTVHIAYRALAGAPAACV